MKIWYAHVSTSDQALALQQDALKAVGRAHIFTDDGAIAKEAR
jgi:DNA invertase Pin-like site-specific DNA recombinase